MGKKLKTYAETVASKLDQNAKTNQEITTSLNKDLKSLRSNFESKIVSEKELSAKEYKALLTLEISCLKT